MRGKLLYSCVLSEQRLLEAAILQYINVTSVEVKRILNLFPQFYAATRDNLMC